MVHIARLLILIAVLNIFVFIIYDGKDQLIKWVSLGFVAFGIGGAMLLFAFSERKAKAKDTVNT